MMEDGPHVQAKAAPAPVRREQKPVEEVDEDEEFRSFRKQAP